MASKSNRSNNSSSSSNGMNNSKPQTSKNASSRAEATSNKPPQKVSYLEELDEDKINEEKAQFRYDEMMQQFKRLTRRSDNEEENENLDKFYKGNAPKKNKEEDKHSQGRRASSRNSTNGAEKDDSYVRNEIRAPNELKEEFLVYIMEKKWEDAFKLCKFILMYEPDNPTAREYFPLIEFKLNQSESESDDDDDDDEEDDDDDDDSDKDEDDEDDDDEDEDDEDDDDEKNDEKMQERKRREEEEVKQIREMYKQMKPKEETRTRSGDSTSSRNGSKVTFQNSIKKPK